MKIKYLIFTALAMLTILNSCNKEIGNSKDMDNIRKAYSSLESHQFDAFIKLCAKDFSELSLSPEPIQGVDAALSQYKVFLEAFPDSKFEVKNIYPAGPRRYFVEIHSTGTNKNAFMGIPATGKSYTYNDIDIIQFNAEGLCTSHASINPNEPLRQIGLGYLVNPASSLVMTAYQLFGQKDIPGLMNLCSDDVVFEIHDRAFDNKLRTFKGKSEVAKFFEELGSKFNYTKFLPNQFAASSNTILVSVDAEFKTNKDNKTHRNQYAHRFEVENGKIKYFKGMDGFDY